MLVDGSVFDASATTSLFDSNDASGEAAASDATNLLITPTFTPVSTLPSPISADTMPLSTPASTTPLPTPASTMLLATPAEIMPSFTPASTDDSSSSAMASSGSRVEDTIPSGSQMSDDGSFDILPTSGSLIDSFILNNLATSNLRDGSPPIDTSESASTLMEAADIASSNPSAGSLPINARFVVANAARLSSNGDSLTNEFWESLSVTNRERRQFEPQSSSSLVSTPSIDLSFNVNTRFRDAATTSSGSTDEFTCDEAFYKQWDSLGLACGGEGIDVDSAVSAASYVIYSGAIGGASSSTCISICSFPSCENSV